MAAMVDRGRERQSGCVAGNTRTHIGRAPPYLPWRMTLPGKTIIRPQAANVATLSGSATVTLPSGAGVLEHTETVTLTTAVIWRVTAGYYVAP